MLLLKKLPIPVLVILLTTGGIAFSQPGLPPREISINATQALSFGSFSLESLSGPGGTVTVDWQGNRTATGQIVLLSSAPSHQAAIFEVNLCQGRSVIITYPSTTVLTGSNGGTLLMEIGPTEKGVSGTSFQVNTDCSFVTQLRVGGKLYVENNQANPGGYYTGNFYITFNQQ
jgi:hypothetical protein